MEPPGPPVRTTGRLLGALVRMPGRLCPVLLTLGPPPSPPLPAPGTTGDSDRSRFLARPPANAACPIKPRRNEACQCSVAPRCGGLLATHAALYKVKLSELVSFVVTSPLSSVPRQLLRPWPWPPVSVAASPLVEHQTGRVSASYHHKRIREHTRAC